jgi:hypothetical protein
MPYVYDPLEEEKNQPLGGQPPMTGGGTTFAGGSSGPVVDQSQQKGANRQGSGFVGLDKYMAANKDSKFGNQLTGNVAGTVNTAKQGIEKGAQDFTQASNQGTTRWDDVGDEFKGIVDTAGAGTTQAQKDRAKSLESATYGGPDAYAGTAAANVAMGGVDRAKQEAGALQSEGGRFALLDRYFGRPSYSMGQKTLDNMLVTGTKGVPAKSQAIMNRANTLGEQANETGRGLENLVASNRQATQDAASQAKGYVGNSLATFQDNLNKRFSDYNAGNDAYNQQIRSAASNVDPAQATRDQADIYDILGIKGDENLYGLHDFSNYLTDPAKPTLSQFTSPEDAAKYKVLGELAGGDFQLPIDEKQAGTAGNGRLTANKNQIQLDIDKRHAAADSQLGSIVQAGREMINNDPRFADGTPERRIQMVQTALQSMKDDFYKTYGFVPDITPEMLWGGAVDYNNPPPPDSPIFAGPAIGGRI